WRNCRWKNGSKSYPAPRTCSRSQGRSNMWPVWLASGFWPISSRILNGNRRPPMLLPPVLVGAWAAALSLAGSVPGGITFNRDVLPIMQKRCQTCHRPGEVAPMSFLTYKDTRPWAKAIREAVLTRKMPPWFADRHFGKFANDRSLNQSEIDTLVSW